MVIQGHMPIEVSLCTATSLHLLSRLVSGKRQSGSYMLNLWKMLRKLASDKTVVHRHSFHSVAYAALIVGAYILEHVEHTDPDDYDCRVEVGEGGGGGGGGDTGVSYCISPKTLSILGVAAIEGWIHFLLFLRGLKLAGISILMLQTMVVSDGLKFGVVFVCVLFGFSQGLFAQFVHASDEVLQGTDAFHYNNLPHVTIDMFRTAVGDANYYAVRHAEHPELAMTIWIVFVVISAVIMVNMLIAMMGETYSRMRESSNLRWMLIRAEVIIEAERCWLKFPYEYFNGRLTSIRPPHHLADGDILDLDGNRVPTFTMQVETRLEPDGRVAESWKEESISASGRVPNWARESRESWDTPRISEDSPPNDRMYHGFRGSL